MIETTDQATRPQGRAVDGVINNSRVRLFEGDCVEGLPRLLAPRSVDVIVTSPPYNLGVDYAMYDDTLTRPEYLAWSDRWATAVAAVLSEDGSFFLNVGGSPRDPWVPLDVAAVMRQHFTLQNTIHWIKSISLDDEPARGHVKPINSPRFLNGCHEYLFHFTHRGAVPLDKIAPGLGVPYADKSNLTRGDRGKNGDRRDRGNCWFVPYKTIQHRHTDRPHPATFPAELARKCIRLHGVTRTHLVLDPFVGIGSAGVAAVSLGLDFVGFDIDRGYLRVAYDRIRAEAAK